MRSFCHTAAYPKPVDVNTHHTLPDFIMNRGGVSLRPATALFTHIEPHAAADTVIYRWWLYRFLSGFPSQQVLVWWRLLLRPA